MPCQEGDEGVSEVWSVELGVTESIDEDDTSLPRDLARLPEESKRLQNALDESSVGIGSTSRKGEDGLKGVVR